MSASHIMNAVTRATPRPAPKPAPAARREAVETDAEPVREKERRPDASRPEFAALLALLAGMGPQVRTDLVQQLPEEAASLVDHLLQGDGQADGLLAIGSEQGAARTKPMGDEHASEDLTYATLHGPPAEVAGDGVVDLMAYARARDPRAESAPATTTDLTSSAARSSASVPANEQALETLARVAAQRGRSLEQMLAVGDARGAETRAALDALLSQAGSPAGARLAALQLLRTTATQALMAPTADAGGMAALPTGARLDDPRLNGVLTAAAAAAESAVRRAADRWAVAGVHTHGHDVATPIKDLETVAPALRSKVARVIDRMKNEYGHDVTVVETARTQERQDWLYEQGRSRSGPVVTWTRDSAHTRGEAVDVLIDGSWDNAAGFARLQRIAREEGLRTLGMKDPGHLELAGAGAPVDPAAAATFKVDRQVPRAEPTASAAGVAQVAGVAGVARVADTSGTARLAGPGAGVADGLAAYAAQAQAGRNGSSSGNEAGAGNSQQFGRGERDARHVGQVVHEPRDSAAPAFGALGTSGSAGMAGTAATDRATAPTAAGSVQAERVADIQQMRADAPAAPLSRMTLNIDHANGTQETITVDVRGNTVQTQITTDAATADRIRLRSADLQDSLGQHGLESKRLRVGASAPQDTVEIGRTLASEREGLRVGAATSSASQDGAAGNGQRDRAPAREWSQEESRREQAARARDERQQQQDRQERQDRQRRATPFFGIE